MTPPQICLGSTESDLRDIGNPSQRFKSKGRRSNPKLAIRERSDGVRDIVADESVRVFVELASKTVETGALAERSLPLEFLEWAEIVGLTFHTVRRETLENLAERHANRSGPERSSFSDRRAKLIQDWVNAPSWSLDEATALSLTVDPDSLHSENLPRGHPCAREYDRRREFASRAREQSVIEWHPTPLDFIVWAESVDIRFHPDWHAALPRQEKNAVFEVKSSQEKSLGTRERESLLKLVIGMAKKGYAYDPNESRSTAPREIAEDLASLGISLDNDTIRKWLKQASELLPGEPLDE